MFQGKSSICIKELWLTGPGKPSEFTQKLFLKCLSMCLPMKNKIRLEIFSSNLFDTVQTKKVHDIGTKLNGRRYVVLSFGKFGTIYLYEGKDSMQTFKTPLVVDKAGSPRIRFYISELNGLLDVSEHLSNFEMLWKAIKEAGSQNKSD